MDANPIAIGPNSGTLLSSVDGFPALVSDPWLNARITTLHACSDLWASGARVNSAQAIITVPAIEEKLQISILSETLAGIKQALSEQGAVLVGGHTMESRQNPESKSVMDLQLSLSVIGSTPKGSPQWNKGPLHKGDVLLLSRALGSGVLFAAAMQDQVEPQHIDSALKTMAKSQHAMLERLFKLNEVCPGCIHACTDITGFGLLGHLSEMLTVSEDRKAEIWPEKIHTYPGVRSLIEAGIESTLAPSNKSKLSLIGSKVIIKQTNSKNDPADYFNFESILVDPQTCGPLLISCNQSVADKIEALGWHTIGSIY